MKIKTEERPKSQTAKAVGLKILLARFFLKWKRKYVVWRAYKRYPYNSKVRPLLRENKRISNDLRKLFAEFDSLQSGNKHRVYSNILNMN